MEAVNAAQKKGAQLQHKGEQIIVLYMEAANVAQKKGAQIQHKAEQIIASYMEAVNVAQKKGAQIQHKVGQIFVSDMEAVNAASHLYASFMNPPENEVLLPTLHRRTQWWVMFLWTGGVQCVLLATALSFLTRLLSR